MIWRTAPSRFPFHNVFFLLVWAMIGLATGDNTKKPEPLLIEPSQYFEGNDGPWSSFSARVGSPPQPVRLLVSTASPQTMVVLSNGCDANVIGTTGPTACAQSRGQMFNPNTSTTWRQASTYAINANGVGFEANLGYKQVALFGLESLGLGLTGGTLANMTVAGFLNARPFYLGVFGLGTQPVNYSTLGNISAPSYISTLKDQNLIPALGWSYTAGAQYRLKKVLAQLIFGGYDTSRLVPNSATFDLAQDQDRDIVVSIQEIIGYKTSQTSLLPEAINAFIDSTDPMIWLPSSAITLFETAFNLTLDKASNRYLITESEHASLVAMDPSVTFRIANSLSGGEVVNIKLPYSAFDLWLDWPSVANKTRYFPLMKADNETQYTLGRTFLQEAYLTVNHEYKNFTVSQCAWTDDVLTPNVKALPSKPSSAVDPSSNSSTPISPDGKTTSDSTEYHHSTTLPTGAIVGIAVSGLLFLVVSVLAVWLLVSRKRKAKSEKVESEASQEDKNSSLFPGSVNEINDPISELSGNTRAHEISDENSCITTAELDALAESSPERQELPTLPTTAGRSELEDSPTVGNNSEPTLSTSSRQNFAFMQHPFSPTRLNHSNSENSHLSMVSSFNDSSTGFSDSSYPSTTSLHRNGVGGSEGRGRPRYPANNRRGGDISELMGSDVPQLP